MASDFYGNEIQKNHIVLIAVGTSFRYAKVEGLSRGVAYVKVLTRPGSRHARPVGDIIRVNARNAFSDTLWSNELPPRETLSYTPFKGKVQ